MEANKNYRSGFTLLMHYKTQSMNVHEFSLRKHIAIWSITESSMHFPCFQRFLFHCKSDLLIWVSFLSLSAMILFSVFLCVPHAFGTFKLHWIIFQKVKSEKIFLRWTYRTVLYIFIHAINFVICTNRQMEL